jgi:hypothetical protein
MADNTVVHIGENSPDEVAFKLMQVIANVENREMYGHGDNPVNREWILRTFAQCKRVVILPDHIDDIIEEFKPAPGQRRR